MDEERENQIEDHKQQLKLKIIKSSEWVGDDERKPSVLLIKNEIEDDDENQIQIHHQQEINTTSTPPLPRICEYCGKGFSSGKALGGHKRYHIQEARKYGAIIPKKAMKLKLKKHKVLYDDVHGSSSPSPSSAKINNTSTTQEEKEKEKEKPVCCLCHKEFPSMKSLFGHMRSHRDRDWRGIQPPPMVMSSDRSRSRSSSCSPPIMAATEEMKKIVHDDDAVDEAEEYYHDQIEDGSLEFTESRVSTYFEPVEVLRSWCKTDKRGRKSSIGDRVAAERLVSLSLGEQEQQEQQSLMVKKIGSKIIDKSSGYDSDDSYWLREDQELELELHVDKQQWSTTVQKNLDYGGAQQARQQPNDYDVISNKRKMTTTKKDKLFSSDQKRPRKSGGLLEVNNLDGGGGGGGVRKKPKTSFKCSSCGKSFPTFQALGGHRSSHNKDKHSNPSTLAEDSAGVGVGVVVGAGTGAARANKVQVQVQVDVKNNSMYNEKLGTCKSSSSQVDVQDEATLMTSEASESSQTGPRKMLDFDLNETYVMEDYEEEDGAN